MNSDARIADIQIMVAAALFDSGWRNAFTPLEITSIPVTAEQPAANDRRIRKRVRLSMALSGVTEPVGGGTVEEDSDLMVPAMTSKPSAPMAKYVGMAKTFPDS